MPLISYNHLLFRRIRPARLLLCRPFGPPTVGLAAMVADAGGVVVEWAGGVASARLPCNITESMSFGARWTVDTEVPEKNSGVALEPVPGRPISPEEVARHGGHSTHALDLVREESPLDPASIKFLESLRDKHRGETVVVIGNGPSLNDTDLNLLTGVATMGVNGIFYAREQLPDPLTYYIVEDTKVFEENTAAIKGVRMSL